MPPDVLDELVGGEHMTRMLDERSEQTELERRETDRQAAADDEAARVVDRESAVLVVLEVCRLGARRSSASIRASSSWRPKGLTT